jgi:hypothetical protein
VTGFLQNQVDLIKLRNYSVEWRFLHEKLISHLLRKKCDKIPMVKWVEEQRERTDLKRKFQRGGWQEVPGNQSGPVVRE